MPRKKKGEMTLQERVDSTLKGDTWEFAEEFGVEVLARCMALHVYAREDGEEWFERLMKKICIRGDEWAHEANHPFMLAMASVGQAIKEAGGVKDYLDIKMKERYGEGN